jgi:hypothetical protein
MKHVIFGLRATLRFGDGNTPPRTRALSATLGPANAVMAESPPRARLLSVTLRLAIVNAPPTRGTSTSITLSVTMRRALTDSHHLDQDHVVRPHRRLPDHRSWQCRSARSVNTAVVEYLSHHVTSCQSFGFQGLVEYSVVLQ